MGTVRWLNRRHALAVVMGAQPARSRAEGGPLHRTPGVDARLDHRDAAPDLAEAVAEALRMVAQPGGELRRDVLAAAVEQLEALASEVRRLRRSRRRHRAIVTRAYRELGARSQRIGLLLRAARAVEWCPAVEHVEGPHCPSCAHDQREGHAPDCALAAALKGGS
jgi:hypothetical protein